MGWVGLGLSMLSVGQIMRGLERSTRRICGSDRRFTSFGPTGLQKFDFPWAGFHVTSKIEPPLLFHGRFDASFELHCGFRRLSDIWIFTLLLDNETPLHKFVGPFEFRPNNSNFCWAFLLKPSQTWPLRFLSCKGLLYRFRFGEANSES